MVSDDQVLAIMAAILYANRDQGGAPPLGPNEVAMLALDLQAAVRTEQRRRLPQEEFGDSWQCTSCKAYNMREATNCAVCGTVP